MINFYRRFIPQAARTLKPLTDSLAGCPKTLEWSADLQAAFLAAKSALVVAVPLVFPLPAAKISLAVDASESHIGGVMQQWERGGWRPLAFFSKKLNAAQAKSSAFDRELLAVYMAVRHFRFMLEGRQFAIFTDHRPLVAAITRVSPPWSTRQQRHLSFISEFSTDMRYLPGSDNVVADSLSRPPSPFAPPSPPSTAPIGAVAAATVVVPLVEIALGQLDCGDVRRLHLSSSLRIVKRSIGGHVLLGDVSTGTFRPLVPTALQHRVFSSVHMLGHPGMRATRRLVASRFCWRGLAKSVSLWARECVECQRSKIIRHVTLPPAAFLIPSRRFQHIHVDLVGPFPPSLGKTYIFTIIDRTSRWAEAVPLSDISAASCAQALCANWVCRFGVPETITSDRGAHFTSAVWAAVCALLGSAHIPTTAYHPQSNGMVERWHRRLKDALRARNAGEHWAEHLPWVLLALRAAPHEDNNRSPAEAVYGSPLVLPGEFPSSPEVPLDPFLAGFGAAVKGSSHLLQRPRKLVPSELPTDLLLAKMVFVRRDETTQPLSPLYAGPYLVVDRRKHFFTLKIGPKIDSVSIHRLKPAFLPATAVPADPPRRGRPPGGKPPNVEPGVGLDRPSGLSMPPARQPVQASSAGGGEAVPRGAWG